MKTSHVKQIINYLNSPGRKITPLEALKLFGCLRLGARIWDIKKMISEGKLNRTVKSDMILDKKSGKRFAQYYFV